VLVDVVDKAGAAELAKTRLIKSRHHLEIELAKMTGRRPASTGTGFVGSTKSTDLDRTMISYAASNRNMLSGRSIELSPFR
jgi:hypothetical protein